MSFQGELLCDACQLKIKRESQKCQDLYEGSYATIIIILAEDHIRFRQIIKKIIEGNKELTVVGEAKDGLELLDLLKESPPDMVITDIFMPRLRGLEAAKKVKELYPQIKVLILTVHKGKDYLDQAMSNGIDGYLLQQEMDEELHPAIQSVRSGKFYISPLLEAKT